jgi:hypothetical protein
VLARGLLPSDPQRRLKQSRGAGPVVRQPRRQSLESPEIANIRAHPRAAPARQEGSMFRLSVVDHVRLNFDRTSQNYTVHARAAERLSALTAKVRIGVLVLIGIATAAATISLIDPRRTFQIVAAIAAGLAFGAYALYVAIGVEGRVSAHRSCAHRLWLVCDRYRSLLAEIEDGLLDRATILQRRDELSAQVHAAYDQGFSLDQNAYEGMRHSADDRARDAETQDEAREVLPPSLHSEDSGRHGENPPVPH